MRIVEFKTTTEMNHVEHRIFVIERIIRENGEVKKDQFTVRDLNMAYDLLISPFENDKLHWRVKKHTDLYNVIFQEK